MPQVQQDPLIAQKYNDTFFVQVQQMASLLASLDSLEKVEIIVAFVIIINIIVIVISIMVMIVNIIVIVISIDICQYPDSLEKVTSKKSRKEGRKHSKREKEAKKNSEDSVMRLVDVIKFSSQLHCQEGLRDLLRDPIGGRGLWRE